MSIFENFFFQNFSIFFSRFFSFFQFSVKDALQKVNKAVNMDSTPSSCIRTVIKFVQPLNPGPLARCSKVLTTRFLKTFWSIWPIT